MEMLQNPRCIAVSLSMFSIVIKVQDEIYSWLLLLLQRKFCWGDMKILPRTTISVDSF